MFSYSLFSHKLKSIRECLAAEGGGRGGGEGSRYGKWQK